MEKNKLFFIVMSNVIPKTMTYTTELLWEKQKKSEKYLNITMKITKKVTQNSRELYRGLSEEGKIKKSMLEISTGISLKKANKNLKNNFNCKMSKGLIQAEIPKSSIDINSLGIDKMFSYDKFGRREKDCKYFMGYKKSENNENSFFLVYQNSKNEWICKKFEKFL